MAKAISSRKFGRIHHPNDYKAVVLRLAENVIGVRQMPRGWGRALG